MTPPSNPDGRAQFRASVEALLEPALRLLAARLAGIDGLHAGERTAIEVGAADAVSDAVLRRVSRVLVLELNAARITGRLTATDSAGRWSEFVDRTCRPGYWDTLTVHYPTLLPRLRKVVDNRLRATTAFAARFATDRAALAALVGTEPGELVEVSFNAGDSHRGGHTVALVRCTGARMVYKPRPLSVDQALARLLPKVLSDEPNPIRVPAALARAGYGWAEYVEHRYCVDDAELRRFYRNLGHWLGLVQLLGGTDLHQENLIAAGPVPVVVDCETLFSPRVPEPPSGSGEATDRAVAMVAGSVLGTGLLPGRGLALGWRGIDSSAIGSLPGQQPRPDVPVVLDAGTDLARVGMAKAPAGTARNHPHPEPVLGRYWEEIVTGFTEQTERLQRLDRDGRLAPLLADFADLPVRAVLRSTETYAELGRMLWHPASLHDETGAVTKAADLLARHAGNAPQAPSDPVVIAAEVAELLTGDIPFFTTTPAIGTLDGPAGTRWGPSVNLVTEALRQWRAHDPDLDRRIIRATLVSAYLNEGWLPDPVRRTPSVVDPTDLDGRRRDLAAAIVTDVLDAAICGDDGTASWVAPVLNPTGWSVQPLSCDLYSGVSGVAVLLAAYLREQAAGRAGRISELPALLDAAVRTMRLTEQRWAEDTAAGVPLRPEPPGGYIGLGSRITGWLLLRRLGAVGDEALEWTQNLAAQLPNAVEDDLHYDLLVGRAGAIVPLLRLAEHTGERRWVELAARLGDQLVALGSARGDAVCWPNVQFPEGIGGFAHGTTGIGWALARLAEVTGDRQQAATAQGAFNYEEVLYDSDRGAWRDLRGEDQTAAAWCHGAAGIGLAAMDLLRRTGDPRWRDVVRRAATAAWEQGTGWNHTCCHGDLGVWELITDALAIGVGPAGLDQVIADAWMVSGLEQYGVVTGLARDAFSPGLLPGAGGIAYQLLRMSPGSTLPSVLFPDPGGPVP
ncbi:MAG: type 2 lantipeptide synthetase LanM family protein [Actinobacteria bacterium]|nr:type 2 lantipeptide synthetase LanM family protein [Actinomycetota bacterium]